MESLKNSSGKSQTGIYESKEQKLAYIVILLFFHAAICKGGVRKSYGGTLSHGLSAATGKAM
jgi:hypothetical protein